MDMTTVLRKVKRQFGDEYNIIINDQDIFDWANEAQLQIIRETATNDISVSRAANTFPITLADRVKVKRVQVNNKALVQTSLPELDLSDVTDIQEGNPVYWYTSSGQVHLYPKPPTADTYNVIVTYIKTPTPLSLVAPYLEWVANPPTGPQYSFLAADTDYDGTGFDQYLNLSFGNVAEDYPYIFFQGTSASVAANLRFGIRYMGATDGIGKFRIVYSDNATVRTTAALDYQAGTPPINDQLLRIRVRYVPSTGTVTLYRISADGVETVAGTDVQAGPFNLSSTSFQPTWGALQAGATANNLAMKLYSARQLNPLGSTLYEFDGSVDLASLPTIPATPYLISSGQQMTVVNNLQVYSVDNVFSVPEVHHEDIVTYCIARAHNKNRNYRGEENAMEKFNQSVTTRRDEMQTNDAPTYKLADPFDYGWDYTW